MSQFNYIFLDIDGVLATTNQYYVNPKKWHPKFKCYRFDTKCVKVFNSILNEIDNHIIILSSDWKLHNTVDEMNEILKWNNVNTIISDFTPTFWGSKFNHNDELEECRAYEILEYVKTHNIENYIVIDDLNLNEWINDEHYVQTPSPNEGIKQSGIKEKIIKIK